MPLEEDKENKPIKLTDDELAEMARIMLNQENGGRGRFSADIAERREADSKGIKFL